MRVSEGSMLLMLGSRRPCATNTPLSLSRLQQVFTSNYSHNHIVTVLIRNFPSPLCQSLASST